MSDIPWSMVGKLVPFVVGMLVAVMVQFPMPGVMPVIAEFLPYLIPLKFVGVAVALAGFSWAWEDIQDDSSSASHRMRFVTLFALLGGVCAGLIRFGQDYFPVAWSNVNQSGILPWDVFIKFPAALGPIVINPANILLSALRLSPPLLLLVVIVSFWSWLYTEPMVPVRVRAKITAYRNRKGWMSTGTAKALKKCRDGIPLGMLAGATLRYPRTLYKEWIGGHHGIFAGTRAGKAVTGAYPAIIDHNGGLLALDLKGELAATCSPYRATLKRRQVILAPLEAETARFSPLSYIRLGPKMEEDVAVVADGLITPTGGDGVWVGDGARELATAALEVVLTTVPEGPGRSFSTVLDLLLGPDRLKHFEDWASNPEFFGRRAAEAGAKIMGASDKERGPVLSHLKTCLTWAGYTEVRKNFLGKSAFSWAELVAGEVDVYLSVPTLNLKEMAGLMRLLTSCAIGAAMRAGKTKRPLLMLLDEFTRLGRMERVLDIATIAAGAGVEAIFIAQDLGTLQDVYGIEGANTLVGSCATIRVFGLGAGDTITSKWVEQQMPEAQIGYTYSQQRGADGKMSRTKHPKFGPLLSQSELLELPPAVQLLITRGKEKLLIDPIISHEHKLYRHKLATA